MGDLQQVYEIERAKWDVLAQQKAVGIRMEYANFEDYARHTRDWGAPFKTLSYKETQLLRMLERGLGRHCTLPALRQLDNILLNHVPPLRRFCRYDGMFMTK